MSSARPLIGSIWGSPTLSNAWSYGDGLVLHCTARRLRTTAHIPNDVLDSMLILPKERKKLTLQKRHNEPDGFFKSPTTRLFVQDFAYTNFKEKPALLTLCEGIHRWRVVPSQMVSNAKSFPCHHVFILLCSWNWRKQIDLRRHRAHYVVTVMTI